MQVPLQRLAFGFLVFEALELFDEVELEFRADPHAEFKGDIFMGIGAAVSPCFGEDADGPCLFYPLFGA